MDDSTEGELWIPYGVVFPPGKPYEETPAYSVSTFRWACKLAVIMNPLLVEIYDPLKHPTAARVFEVIKDQKIALDRWWHDLPENLRLQPEDLSVQCPPSHIVTLKYKSSPLVHFQTR